MNIVVLDGYTLNPGDLSWDELKNLGNCSVYERTAVSDIFDRCQSAEIVITNKTPLSAEVINSLPYLRYIGVIATGYNIVDVAAARKKNIPVSNVPTYGTKSVAQMVFALILELTQHAGHHSATVRAGRWSRSPDFCYWDYPLIELDSLSIGIVGYGRIGQAVARLADAFGMQVRAFDPFPPGLIDDFTTLVDLDTIFRESDIVSLHCPLTADNYRFVNTEKLTLMKKTAFLINTSRGQLVQETDLVAALNAEHIAGAGLDVLFSEPPPFDNPLLQAKNCIITPHISWATTAARLRLMQVAVENLQSFLQGNPKNIVN
jgi:glycerate dehydrogenase